MPLIAHISDLHFSQIGLNPLQFFSKRWLGNANLLLSRKKRFSEEILAPLPALFEEKGVEWVTVTGDLTSTGSSAELKKAKRFIQEVEQGRNVLIIPGNHDHYTKRDYRKKRFYQYFSNTRVYENRRLVNDQFELGPLFENWWYLCLETAIPTSLIYSTGLFSKHLEEKLIPVLKSFPKDQKILMMNHFPFFQFDKPKNSLWRGEYLGKLLQETPQVQLYLHGHTHRHCIADLRASHYPIILDSGCISFKERASFNLLDLKDDSCALTVYRYQEDKWQPTEEKTFHFGKKA
ncbi:MAG TPA: metallophosphoesterase [Chlamydiales bacterium]|nr:metallophosphoesterase [Chlamydiales bacterium]